MNRRSRNVTLYRFVITVPSPLQAMMFRCDCMASKVAGPLLMSGLRVLNCSAIPSTTFTTAEFRLVRHHSETVAAAVLSLPRVVVAVFS